MHQDPSPTQPDWLDAHQASVGRYVLGPILGLGGAGEVREAWDVVLCRTVALKVLRKMEPVGLIRFMHEAQIQSRIAHPNICRIYDVDNSGGIPKIAMQLVRGPTLSQVAHELTVKEVVVILAQVAEAIHAAHRLNLIHRDLKPSNILLERSPEGRWTPVVCDFGLAMALDEPSLTLGPGLLGTPAFMAPEQSRGERRLVGPATDVYALGATLHFALFGDPPALGPEGSALPRRGGALRLPEPQPRPAPGPGDHPAQVPGADPGLRYPTAMALAEDLWLFADGAPIRARPVSALEHRWRQLRRSRMVVLAVLLAAAAVLTGRLVEKGRLTRQQRRRAQAEQVLRPGGGGHGEGAAAGKDDAAPRHAAGLRAAPGAHGIHPRADGGPGARGPGAGPLCPGLRPTPAQGLRRRPAGPGTGLEPWGPGTGRGLVPGPQPDRCRPHGHQPGHLQHRVPASGPGAAGGTGPGAAGAGPRRQEQLQRVHADALLAFVRQDYRRCAASAHACFLAHPWQFEAATLESLALSSQGHAQFDRGDLQGAEASYREAMAAAEHFLVFGHSDEFTYHAYFIAAQRLAFLLASRGRLTLSYLDDLRTTADWVMILDPSEPELQDDWLQFGLIKACRLRDLGRDSGPELAAVRMFLDTRAQDPSPRSCGPTGCWSTGAWQNWLAAGAGTGAGAGAGLEGPGPHLRVPAPGFPG